MKSHERWMPIPGFDGYEVSDRGQVRSFRPKNGVGDLRRGSPTILSPGNAKGYLIVRLYVGKRSTSVYKSVHGLVMLAFVGPCPKGKEICHRNSNRRDNRLSNLRYDTKRGNAADRPSRKGMGAPRRKLNQSQVNQIRGYREQGWTQQAIADKFQISQVCVSNIINGKTWS